ncbi:MAG TPA: LysR family transcriptional regulator, partial [Ktedonobacterales bacterium]|nr:LysR family transcriptional regulator [Ktedonobacterales bacterium]
HIAQPTISARIQALEHELGGPLFVRNSRRVSLTERGASFLPYARRALAALTEGSEVARWAHSGQHGRLTVGALRSLTGSFMTPALAEFHRTYPGVECYVREGDQTQIVELLTDGVIELGMIVWPYLDPVLAAMTPLFHMRESLALVAGRDHPLAREAVVRQADILERSQPFLLQRWWQSTPPLIARLAAQARSVADVPQQTGRYLVVQGVGVGFFPSILIEEDVEAGRVVTLTVEDLPPIYRDTALVRLTRTAQLSSAATHFSAMLRERAQLLGLLRR